MKIDFDKEIVDLDGKPIKETRQMVREDGVVVTMETDEIRTLKSVCRFALSWTFNDEKVEGDEKFKRFSLAERIVTATGPIDVKVEEIALLKSLIGKAFGPVIVGRAYQILEGEKELGE